MKKTAFAGLFIIVLTVAVFFRLVHLDSRPMHHDEANQAVKFGLLLEKGEYRYDRTDHHGPSLYYLTLPSAWLFSRRTLASLDEKTLRLLPGLFGACVLLLFLLAEKELGRITVIFAGLLVAVSPVFVYYSRFYIQEMLLVFFLVGFLICVWRLTAQSSLFWAVLAGLFSGLMYATKETSVIAFGAALAALAAVFLFFRESRPSQVSLPRMTLCLLAGASVFILVGWLFFSSFLQNPAGWLDSIRSFQTYLTKASHPEMHAHPWFYYLKILSYTKDGNGPLWSEGLILGLAVIGSAAAFSKKISANRPAPFLKFVFFFTLFCLLSFSSFSYKTPWNLLPFYVGIVILAGAGGVSLLHVFKKQNVRAGIFILIGLGTFHLGRQAYLSSFIYAADPKNPYVYAQTTPDFLNLVRRVQGLSSLHPDGQNMIVRVISNSYDTWPLPWYLRAFHRVGYWQDVEEAGELKGAPLIIASMDMVDKLPPVILESYQQEFFGLRPEVLLAVFIRGDLWQDFLQVRFE